MKMVGKHASACGYGDDRTSSLFVYVIFLEGVHVESIVFAPLVSTHYWCCIPSPTWYRCSPFLFRHWQEATAKSTISTSCRPQEENLTLHCSPRERHVPASQSWLRRPSVFGSVKNMFVLWETEAPNMLCSSAHGSWATFLATVHPRFIASVLAGITWHTEVENPSWRPSATSCRYVMQSGLRMFPSIAPEIGVMFQKLLQCRDPHRSESLTLAWQALLSTSALSSLPRNEEFYRSRLALFLLFLSYPSSLPRFRFGWEDRILGIVVVNPWYCGGWMVRREWYCSLVGDSGLLTAIQEARTAPSWRKALVVLRCSGGQLEVRFGWVTLRQLCRRTADGRQR